VLDIVTGVVVASGSTLLESSVSRRIMEQTTEMTNNILRQVVTRVGGSRKVSSEGNGVHPMLAGLSNDVSRSIRNFRGTARWNGMRNSSELEVDLSGVNIIENRQLGSAVYRISGAIRIYLTDSSGNSGDAEVEIADFTEMTSELIKRNITGQLRIANIVRDLLDSLDENNS
jgi:hypothetical protein